MSLTSLTAEDVPSGVAELRRVFGRSAPAGDPSTLKV